MSDFGPIVGLGGFLISYPAICAYYTWKNRGIIHTKEEQKKTGKLYTGIALYRSFSTAFYYPVFMARRFLFVLIPIIFAGRPYLQIQFLVMFSSFYLVWFGSIQPYVTLRATGTEMFNEFMFMILLYHLFLFSDFTMMRVYHPRNFEYKYVPTGDAQAFFGFTYLACMLILTFVNMIIVVLNTSDKMK